MLTSPAISARTRAAMADQAPGSFVRNPGNLSPQHAAKGRILAPRQPATRQPSRISECGPSSAPYASKDSSLGKIADELNAREFVTRRMQPWNKIQVQRVLARA